MLDGSESTAVEKATWHFTFFQIRKKNKTFPPSESLLSPYLFWNKLQFVYAMETKEEEVVENAMTFIARIFNEIVSSPLNLALLGAIGYVAYKIIATQMEERKVKPEEPPLPKVRFKSLVNMFVN